MGARATSLFEISSPYPSGRTVIVYESDESYSMLDLLLMSELQISSSSGHSA